MKLSSDAYDRLKSIAQVWLPALGTLYVALAVLWHLPAAEQVSGSVVAVDAALGAVLSLSSLKYKASGEQFDGQIHVTPQPDGPTEVALEMKSPDPMAFLDKDQVTFKVNPPTLPAPNLTDPRLLADPDA